MVFKITIFFMQNIIPFFFFLILGWNVISACFHQEIYHFHRCYVKINMGTNVWLISLISNDKLFLLNPLDGPSYVMRNVSATL